METEVYETEVMDYATILKFTTWLNREIGTEYEINETDRYNGEKYIGTGWYIMVFDLTLSEVEKIRAYENQLEEANDLKQ